MQQKTIVGAIIIIVLIVCGFAVWKLHAPAPVPETSTDTSTTPPTPISAAKVPDGWHSHETYGMENAITVLSKTTELPNNPNIEQIAISKMTTSLAPEDFITRQAGGDAPPDNTPEYHSSWGIYKGHKTLSVTSTAGGVAQWFVYVFGGTTVYEFTLAPNDAKNPNLAQDRTDFWRVITYYVQESSFGKLARTETQQNCKTTTLPENQERNVQTDPEDGYVVASYLEDDKTKYVFLNYNDDLSQCTPSVKEFLQHTKESAAKLPQ
ncbi:hypothetical protein H0X32_01365 [Patescibacteria group bacterium]|nr:hypothetical protein [Patescibacteria group bacterium]